MTEMIRKVTLVNGGLPEEWFGILSSCASRRLRERGGVGTGDDAPYRIRFAMADLPEDAYTVAPEERSVLLLASTQIGFFSALGRFLRNSDLYPEKGMRPGTFCGTAVPEKPIRAMYYATHNYNYYHVAPEREIFDYLEDCALWGQNVIEVWYDLNHYQDIDTPESLEFIAFLKKILFYAKKIGMKTAFTSNANEAFLHSEPELRADWRPQGKYFRVLNAHYRKEYCPSKKGGMEAILRDREAMLAAFADTDPDYFITWPYDQGGCTCEKCAPWGANGYLRIARELRPLVAKYFPHAKLCLSAWYFDRFIHGEWDAFYEEIRKGDWAEWVGFLVANFQEGDEIPSFIRRDKNVAGIPLIDFTEISMFDAKPWGGFGSNASPRKFQALWERVRSYFAGGLPYSEGIHEDVNKILMFGFFSGQYQSADDILREYIRFEFSPETVERITEILTLLGGTLRRVFVEDAVRPDGKTPFRYMLNNTANVDYIWQRVQETDETLDAVSRKSWRWRIIYLRAGIDHELKKEDGFISETCASYMKELETIYHTETRSSYPVSPPTPDSVEGRRGYPAARKNI